MDYHSHQRVFDLTTPPPSRRPSVHNLATTLRDENMTHHTQNHHHHHHHHSSSSSSSSHQLSTPRPNNVYILDQAGQLLAARRMEVEHNTSNHSLPTTPQRQNLYYSYATDRRVVLAAATTRRAAARVAQLEERQQALEREVGELQAKVRGLPSPLRRICRRLLLQRMVGFLIELVLGYGLFQGVVAMYYNLL